jgi:hypothetical protein
VFTIHVFSASGATVGSRSLIFCLVRPITVYVKTAIHMPSSVALACLFAACEAKPVDELRLESHITSLVRRHATAEQVIAELGPPSHIYSQSEVLGYLFQTPEGDVAVRETWTLFSRYPEAMYYQGPPTFQNYIFLDASRAAVAFHFTSQ